MRKIITDALASSRHVLREPEPFVFIAGPNQLGIEYIVGFSFPSYMDWFEAQDEAMSAIWSAFRRHGIRPGVNHHYVDAGGAFDAQGWPARQAESMAAAMPDVIAGMALFEGAGAARHAALAASARCRDYVPPETILEIGAAPSSLFIVGGGSVDLVARDETGADYVAAELKTGDVFGAPVTPAGAREVGARSGAYGTVYEIPAEALAEAKDDMPDFAARLESIAATRAVEFEGRRKAHAYEVRRRAREREKAQIVTGLTSHLGAAFKTGLLGGPAAKRRRELLLEAVMAATALVAYADGEIETAERDEVITTLDELDILRRAGGEAGIERFDAFAAELESDLEAGQRHALSAIGELKGDADMGKLVVDICIAISAADGEIEEEEEARIVEIRAAIGLADEAAES